MTIRTFEDILKSKNEVNGTIYEVIMRMTVKLEEYFEALHLMTGEKKYLTIFKKIRCGKCAEEINDYNLLEILTMLYDYAPAILGHPTEEELEDCNDWDALEETNKLIPDLLELLDEKFETLNELFYFLYIEPIKLLEERCGKSNAK